jgi:DNA repair protein SbcC/Rad50
MASRSRRRRPLAAAQEAETRLASLNDELQRQGAIQEQEQRQLAVLQRELSDAQASWQQALAASPFADEAAFIAARLEEDERQQLQARLQALQQAQALAADRLAQAEQAWQQLGPQPPAPLAELEARERRQQDAVNLLQQQLGRLDGRLEHDAAQRRQQQALLDEIERGRRQLHHWEQLNSLIGSADGARYRRFAQGLTLEHLVHLANRRLARLHGRYRLARKDGGELELAVIDGWQADAARIPRPCPAARASWSAWRWRWRCRIWSAARPASTPSSSTRASAPWTPRPWRWPWTPSTPSTPAAR